MTKGLTYKSKLFATVIILIVSGFLLYKYGIGKTIQTNNRVKYKTAQAAELKSASREIPRLESEVTALNLKISEGSSYSDPPQRLLSSASQLCKMYKSSIVDISQIDKLSSENLITYYLGISIQGSYKNLLRILHSLEEEASLGEVLNIQFEAKKNIRTRKTSLTMLVTIKSISNV